MAEVHLQSTLIDNATASPPVANNAHASGGILRAACATLESTAADSVGSTYRFVRVPSCARIHKVIYAADAAGDTGQVAIGLYQTEENGGAVVDADFFADGIDPGGGAIAPTDVTHESGQYNIAEAAMPLWQALGLSADPGIEYDVTVSCTEILANAGTHTIKVEFVV